MEIYRINGGKPLKGTVRISGSKNAALPLLAASILIKGKVVFEDIPALKDVFTMFELLEHIGADIDYDPKSKIAVIDTSNISKHEVPYELVKKMRASFILAGPLLAIFKKAKVSLPGGCAIGSRPVDIHLKCFEKLLINCRNKSGNIIMNKSRKKEQDDPVEIILDFPSVGGTQNIIMASIYENRTVRIINWAKEPEVVVLIDFLKEAGANIKIDENVDIVIKGGKQLKKSVNFKNIPDRIEAGTFMIGTLITGGEVKLTNINIPHLKNMIEKCIECGAVVDVKRTSLEIKASKKHHPIRIKTLPYPGFSTDLQAQFSAFLATVPGSSIIEETIFENRFNHIPELIRMGADIFIDNDSANISGVEKLTGAQVMASDLRAGAALVLAGLFAQGETVVRRIYHIDRGYEEFDDKLRKLGAEIVREKLSE